MGYPVRLKVWRGDASAGGLEEYEVEANEGEVVLDVIHRLQATQTPDLAVRWNCKAGKCGSCSAEVNGRPRLMCMTRMSSFDPDDVVTVTPLRTFPVLRDLVTDVSFNYAKAREVPAFTPPPNLLPGQYRMSQSDVERSQEFRKCIECFLCQDVCHVIRDHEQNKEVFSGPRFLIRIAELEMHPLDVADRRRFAQKEAGLGFCNITKCCTEVCPEGIRITDNGIIPMKERVVDEMYDPLFWLGRLVPHRLTRDAAHALEQGDLARAERAARERLTDSPHDRGALGALEASLAGQGRFAEAARAARAVAAQAPRAGTTRMAALDRQAFDLLAAVEAGQLDAPKAVDEAREALRGAQLIASTGVVLQATYALLAVTEGDHVEAERSAREVLAWDRPSRERSDALLTLARVRAAAGDGGGAVNLVREARETWGANPRLDQVERLVATRTRTSSAG